MSPIEVTVLMPVYNGEEFLREALNSVLAQEHVQFEVLALNDGSVDDSLKILQSCSDSRLKLVSHSNCGLSATLNKGLKLVNSPYISRQDQDDLMLSHRLIRQLDFLKKNPNVGMVGTWAQIYIGANATQRFHHHPLYSDTLRLKLLFDNPFVHSSVMIRTEVLKSIGGYSEDKSRQPPEDYELWSRIAREYDIANLPEVLTIYREMPKSMSRTESNPFLPKVLKIATENLYTLLKPCFSEAECMSVANLYHGLPLASSDKLTKRKVLTMLDLCAEQISKSGPRSDEFQIELLRLRKHFNSRLARQWVPKRLLDSVRPLVNVLRKE
jgi:glycosyltransferase involved in cell wall biosynthesis